MNKYSFETLLLRLNNFQENREIIKKQSFRSSFGSFSLSMTETFRMQ